MANKITASTLEIIATIITGDAAKQSTNSTKNLYSQLQYRTLGALKSLFRMFEIIIDYGTRHNVTLDGLIKLNEKGLISNTANLVNNIAKARDKNSSSHAPEYKPKKHHAQFCLEQSMSLMNFIISVDESKK